MIDQRLLPRQVVALRANGWDMALLPLVLLALAALAYGATQMTRPYQVGQTIALTLDPTSLPYYLLRTTMRMAAALLVSLVFSCAFAALAAKSRTAERVLVPLLDVLQSIPILGFLSITVTGFIALFPGNLFGVECAAIFAIFTSQAWNMAFSLYQSMRTVPPELQEAARVFQLSGWQRFWRMELPYAMPGLLWNMMMSVSGGWFFVVASEAISVANQSIKLPGVGSYIAMAIEARDLGAIGWAILAMFVAIVLYDQLLFRPLLAWADKFRFEAAAGEVAPRSWVLTWVRRTEAIKAFTQWGVSRFERSLALTRRTYDGTSIRARNLPLNPTAQRVLDAVLAGGAILAIVQLLRFVHAEVGWGEAGHVFLLGIYTMTRVVVLIVLASLIWVPIGIWIGMNPRWAGRLQAIAQFLAAFPANLLFPITVVLLVRWHLNPDIWLSPLMVFGTQWYVLFNVIAGASTIPTELRLAARNLGLRGWLRWRRYLLPAGVSELRHRRDHRERRFMEREHRGRIRDLGRRHLAGPGHRQLHRAHDRDRRFPRITLGIGVMCVFVMGMNHWIWRRLYRLAEDRMHS